MPVIKPRTARTTCVRHITQLYAENQEDLYAYARFINESTAYVLNALIETLRKDDPKYRVWLVEHPESCVPVPGTSTRGSTRAARGVSAAQRAGIAALPGPADRDPSAVGT